MSRSSLSTQPRARYGQSARRFARRILWQLPERPYPSDHPRSLRRPARDLRA